MESYKSYLTKRNVAVTLILGAVVASYAMGEMDLKQFIATVLEYLG